MYLQSLKPVNSFAHWNTLVSFSIGTVLLLIYLLFKESSLIEIGIAYLIVAVVWNCLIFILIIIAAIGQKTALKETIVTIGVLVLNIPIAFGYFLIVVELT